MTGYVIMDPESVTTAGEKKLAKIRVAVRGAGDGMSEESKDGIFTVDIWGKQAEYVENYVRKGSMVAIDGRFKLSRWIDKDTQKNREKVQFVASNISAMNSDKSSKETTSYEPIGVGSTTTSSDEDLFSL